MRFKNAYYLLFFVLLSLAIIAIWFRDGMMYGLGEEQIPFYRPDYVNQLTQFQWWENEGTGMVKPQWFATKPFYKITSYIYQLTNSGILVQQIFFGAVFLSAFVFTFLIGKEVFKKKKGTNILAILSALLYTFNPYMQAAVWRRFLFTTIGLFGLLPLVFWLFIRGIEKKNILYSFLITLSLTLFSVIYRFPGNLITLFIPLFIFILFYFKRKGKREVRFALFFCVFSLLSYLFINLWWMIPLLSNSTGLINQLSTLENDLISLKAISVNNTLFTTIRMIAPHYYYTEMAWGEIYKSVAFQIISWISPVFIFLGIYKGWSKKYWIKIFAVIFAVALFLSNGANPPFGELFYKSLFKYIPATRMFRNPIEKLGILLPFSYAFLSAQGVYELYIIVKERYRKNISFVLIGTLVFLMVGVYPWPMWTGKTISFEKDEPAYVVVPKYYAEADNFFNSDKDDFRILALPLANHGIAHDWDYGYSGGELSRDVFKKPVFARTIGTNNAEFFSNLNHTVDKDWFFRYLPLLSVKYLLVRDDIDHERSNLPNPKDIIKILDKREEVNYLMTFGNLHVYELDTELQRPHIFAENRVYKIQDENTMIELLGKEKDGVFILSEDLASELENMEVTTDTGSLPKISFIKYNPENYRVFIKGASSPFVLVFSETFHPTWNVVVEGEQPKHFLVNGYANGFLINKKGDYEINLTYGSRN